MEKIKELIATDTELSPDQILSVFEYVGQRGDVIVLKNDGLREHNKYTAVIIGTDGTIRHDDATLSSALIWCLKEYIKIQ